MMEFLVQEIQENETKGMKENRQAGVVSADYCPWAAEDASINPAFTYPADAWKDEMRAAKIQKEKQGKIRVKFFQKSSQRRIKY